jgi:hypothetical protein
MSNFVNWVRERVDEEYLHIGDMREVFRGKVRTLYPFTGKGWKELGIQYGGHKLWARGDGWYIGIITPQLLIRRPPRTVCIVVAVEGSKDNVIQLPLGQYGLRSHEIVELMNQVIPDLPDECAEAFAYLLGAYWYYEGRL